MASFRWAVGPDRGEEGHAGAVGSVSGSNGRRGAGEGQEDYGDGFLHGAPINDALLVLSPTARYEVRSGLTVGLTGA